MYLCGLSILLEKLSEFAEDLGSGQYILGVILSWGIEVRILILVDGQIDIADTDLISGHRFFIKVFNGSLESEMTM